MKKEVGEVLDAAVEAGFEFDRYTGTGHYRLTHPGGDVLVLPATPRGKRWKKNTLAEIKRATRKDRST